MKSGIGHWVAMSFTVAPTHTCTLLMHVLGTSLVASVLVQAGRQARVLAQAGDCSGACVVLIWGAQMKEMDRKQCSISLVEQT